MLLNPVMANCNSGDRDGVYQSVKSFSILISKIQWCEYNTLMFVDLWISLHLVTQPE